MLLTWHLAQSYFLMLQKTMVEENFQNCSYKNDDVINYVNFFERICEKWLKYAYFLKLTLWQLDLFSAFESQETYKLNIYIG